MIDTAISLWISDKDPLSIHLLVKSCYQVVRDLGAKKGIAPMSHTMVEERQFNLVYDFLRHASGSVNEGVDFAPSTNGMLLYEVIETFEELFHKRTVYMKAFTVYFAFMLTPKFPEFRELAYRELPKGVTDRDFATLDKRAFFAKAVRALLTV